MGGCGRRRRPQRYALGLKFLAVLWGLLRLTSKHVKGHQLLTSYALCLAAACIYEVLVYFVGLIPSDMYRVLVALDVSDFMRVCLLSLAKVLGVAVVRVILRGLLL